MSGKQEKKIRQLVRRNQTSLVNQSWDCFFKTISEMRLKYRIKLAWQIVRGKNIHEEEERKRLEKEKLDRAFLGIDK